MEQLFEIVQTSAEKTETIWQLQTTREPCQVMLIETKYKIVFKAEN